MNKKQKTLTGVMLPIFLLFGLLFAGGGFGAILTAWFALGVVYAGLFFILGPTRK